MDQRNRLLIHLSPWEGWSVPQNVIVGGNELRKVVVVNRPTRSDNGSQRRDTKTGWKGGRRGKKLYMGVPGTVVICPGTAAPVRKNTENATTDTHNQPKKTNTNKPQKTTHQTTQKTHNTTQNQKKTNKTRTKPPLSSSKFLPLKGPHGDGS